MLGRGAGNRGPVLVDGKEDVQREVRSGYRSDGSVKIRRIEPRLVQRKAAVSLRMRDRRSL